MTLQLYIGRELWREVSIPGAGPYVLVPEQDDWVSLQLYFEERTPRKYYLTKAYSVGEGQFTNDPS